ncbi:MAG: hypothetical protein HY403_07250, partial [Elusimicrobia bacterium]|nr:hypothetical protein [Elusimicrobiota bacterium]
ARPDARLQKVLRAAAKSAPGAAAASVDAVMGKLLNAAASRDPEAADRIFDDLRARLRADFAVGADLDAVKADFARKDPIRYAPPGASDADGRTSVHNCEEALNGAPLSAGGLCGHSAVGASLLAGLLDAFRQQFGTAAGLLANGAAMLLGLVFGLLTGGVGLIVKILFALGMTAWAVYELVPAFGKALRSLWTSKEGSRERYAAVRQLSTLAGSVLIMALLAVAGGKIGNSLPPAWEAKVAGMTAKVSARMPTRISAMLSKWAAAGEARAAAPKLDGASRAMEAPGRPLPSAVHSAEKGYALVAEESLSAAKTGKASRLAEKTVTEYLEKELPLGASADPVKARTVLAAALEKADLALRHHAARNPAEAASVDLSVAVVAKDAAGRAVLVSARAGEAGVFLRRGGQFVPQQKPAPAKVGIKELAKEFWSDLKGEKPSARVQLNESSAAGGEALGSARYRPPRIEESVLQPKDTIFAAGRGSAETVSGARHLRAGAGLPRAIAELNIPAKRGFLAALAGRMGTRQASYRTNVFQQAAIRYAPAPPAPTIDLGSGEGSSEGEGTDDLEDEGKTTAIGEGKIPPPVQAQLRLPPETKVDKPSVAAGGGSAAGSGGGGGEGDSAGKGPKPPKFGGSGDKGGGGGGGGGGPAGNGADGGGGGERGGPDGHGGAGGATPPGGRQVGAAPPPDLLGGGSASPRAGGSGGSPNDTALGGGHSPAPSLASRFDGARPRSESAPAWSPIGMKGLGAGDSPGLPRLMPRDAALSAPEAREDEPYDARTAGGAVAPAPSGAPGLKSEDEDFNYTYLASPRHKYELPTDRPPEKDDLRRLLSLGLPGAASALALAYLIYHSDLPYLLGLTRRRRDGTYG